MLTKEQIASILSKELPNLRAEFGVRRLGLFGSFAKEDADARSDVDIVAEFERPIGLRFVDFAERLEQLLGRKADVLTPTGISHIRNKRIAEEIKRTILYV